VVSSAFLLLFSGHKTTAYMIGNAVYHLLANPEQHREVQDDPALIDGAVEELLRFDTSVENATFRFAAEDVAINGTVIPRGALVQICLSSANRDPGRFGAPDELDVLRPERDRSGQLAFRHG